jgi:hypothetical protein
MKTKNLDTGVVIDICEALKSHPRIIEIHEEERV